MIDSDIINVMLEQRIYKDYTDALRARDKARIDFLSFIRAELKNVSIDLKKSLLDDSDVCTVLKRQKKRLEESKESFVASGRKDLIEQGEREIAILNGYLPQALSDAEVGTIIEQVIVEMQAASIKDMGRVMKEVLSRAGASADAKKASEMVKKRLSLKPEGRSAP